MISLSKFRYLGFTTLLCTLAFATSYCNKNEMWGMGSLLLVFLSIISSLLFYGISLQSAAFASVATLPNLNSFIRLGNFSLTLIEIYMTLFVAIYVLQNARILITRFTILFCGLYFACVASLVGSPLGLSSAGVLLRFGLLLVFITILISQPSDKDLFKPSFLGLLAVPFVACFTYAGEGILVDIFVLNLFEQSRALYSFQYPIWFAFALPFLLFIKAPKSLILFVSLLIALLVVFSSARSIVIGAAAAGMLFVIFHRDHKPIARLVAKLILLFTMTIAFVSVIAVLNAFDFTTTDSFTDDPEQNSKTLSNATRWDRVQIAVARIKERPLLGSGFGTAVDNALAEKESRAQVFSERITPEFGPLSVMTEIGLIGGFFLSCIIAISFNYSVKCLRNRDIPMAHKFTVLVAFGGFVSSFINSNALTLILIYIFLAIPILAFKHSGANSRHSKLADSVSLPSLKISPI